MRDVEIDFMGTLTATVSQDEFKRGQRTFYEEGQLWKIVRMQGQKDGSVRIQAKRTEERDDEHGSLVEYPVGTRYSPNRALLDLPGKIENRKGKRKFKETEPKVFQPLKGDGFEGRGELRRRYIR